VFEVALQTVLVAEGIARKTVGALSSQQGKRHMKQTGTVEVPQEAFLAVLKVER
jgi:translation elongation factor EF-4